IYSVAGKMSPVGDFRPASPDSFEDDYDDVSLSESDRGQQIPTGNSKPQGKATTGRVYTLAGQPSPSPVGLSLPAPRAEPEEDPKGWDHAQIPRESQSGCAWCQKGVAVSILYVLVALSFSMWALLLGMALAKQTEIMEELKLLRLNSTENSDIVRQELSEWRREHPRLRNGMQLFQMELQDVTELLCRALENSRKCSAGWKSFEKSCYSFSAEASSWDGARDACADLGAHLVVVSSSEEQ
ncbi:C-type lectin domain family 17, member A, partial [Acanthisitta chloris]